MKIVIVGQGYVGLPLAIAAGKSGYEVVGFDSNENLVQKLNLGLSHVEDIPSIELEKLIKSGNYIAT
jgi:UDP-N-acetyl-D-glucosamine dehydrogenase